MTEPKELIGALYLSEREPRITGQIQIGTTRYDVAGIRRSDFTIELSGQRIKRKTPIPQTPKTQMDMFDENSSISGERKLNSP